MDVYLTAWRYLLHCFWTLHQPPNTPDVLGRALADVPVGFAPGSGSDSSDDGKGKKLFTTADVAAIVRAAGDPQYKDALRRTTEEALGRGAFGAPWLWATNGETGRSEPFFGSDRWHHVYEFLGLPYRDVELLSPGEEERGRVSKL